MKYVLLIFMFFRYNCEVILLKIPLKMNEVMKCFLKTEIVVIIPFRLDEVWRQPYFTSITLGLDRKILTLNARINIDCTGWWFPLLNQNIYAPTLRMTGGSNWFGRILEIKRLESENKNINNLHNRCPKCIFAFFLTIILTKKN